MYCGFDERRPRRLERHLQRYLWWLLARGVLSRQRWRLVRHLFKTGDEWVALRGAARDRDGMGWVGS